LLSCIAGGQAGSDDLAIIEFESRREKVKAISNCACNP
jgi:hypothetical protein